MFDEATCKIDAAKIVKEKKLKEIKCLLVTNHGVNVNSNVAMMTINLEQ